jgi:ring-1,2-phenylacetyl-CoA epoxidase subunit PaaA
LELQADGSYKFGEIDWQEFYEVVKGNGPCNKQRLDHHIKAHNEGVWVREAAIAYGMSKSKEIIAA